MGVHVEVIRRKLGEGGIGVAQIGGQREMAEAREALFSAHLAAHPNTFGMEPVCTSVTIHYSLVRVCRGITGAVP